jgi:dimethylglycine dehydrogenase
MKSHARVVVIGGGVVGVSTLYHLAKKGWSDVVLVERKELTSGSTWHAAGLLPLFNMSYSVGQIHKYSVALYKTLEAETGQNVGFSVCSNIRLARTKDRWDEFMYYAGVAKTIGVNVNVLSPGELKEIWPLCETDGILGAIQHPDDGYIQPADLTQALARGARTTVRRSIATRRSPASSSRLAASGWSGRTRGTSPASMSSPRPGTSRAAPGPWSGSTSPSSPVEHQYIVTEPHPGHPGAAPPGAAGDGRAPGGRFLLVYARGGRRAAAWPLRAGAPACYVDGPSDESEYELFQEDLERLMPQSRPAIARVPAFGEVGIKKVYNGAIAYTPDGSPIIGPAWDLKNFWLNEGHSFGVTAAGGAGWQLAEWIVEGEPSIDMLGVDPAPLRALRRRGYLKAKNEEAYAKVFTMHYPDEERAAARR